MTNGLQGLIKKVKSLIETVSVLSDFRNVCFPQNGDEIRNEGECKVCTCEDFGEMSCGKMECSQLNCEEDELVSYREEQCCPYCLSDWVEVSSLHLYASSSRQMNSVINHISTVAMY